MNVAMSTTLNWLAERDDIWMSGSMREARIYSKLKKKHQSVKATTKMSKNILNWQLKPVQRLSFSPQHQWRVSRPRTECPGGAEASYGERWKD